MGITYNELTNKYSLHVDEAQEALGKKQYEAALIARVAGLLPEGLPIERFFVPSYWGNIWIDMTVNERMEAVDLSRITGTVPLVVYRDGCTSIFPVEQLTDKKRERGTYVEFEPFFTWEAECHYWRDHSTHVRMEWWFKLEEIMVLARCNIKNDPARIWEQITRNQKQQIISRMWMTENFPAGDRLNYASGTHGKPGPKVVYNVRGI